ncbi:FHA domain-containing protein [Holdemania massiliensis]|uniref:FHA domain-containing protein n=1 Tax=Holdemania massiliensis TaxID=1468449 RepID=UPI0035682920
MKTKIKIKKKEGTRTLILHSEKGQSINQVDLKKLHDQSLPGFIEPIIQSAMGKKLKLSYSITGTHSLEWILKHGVRKETFIDLIDQLNQVLKLVENQNLDIRSLLLDRKTVMISQNSGQLNLIYIPIQYYDCGCDVRRFYESLAYNTVFDSQEETVYVTDYLQTLNSSVTFAKFLMEEYVARHRQNRTDQDRLICPHCGNQVKEGEIFCSFCNADLRESVSNENRAVEVPISQKATPFITGAITTGATTVLTSSCQTTVLQENPASEKAWLEQIRGKIHIAITKFPFVIGKEKNQTDYTVLGNTNVSRKHIQLSIKDERIQIQDLNSTNHTYVNGKCIQPGCLVPLTDQDRILLGNEEFIFHEKGTEL